MRSVSSILFSILCMAGALAQCAHADEYSVAIYRETDAGGIVRFTDQPRTAEAQRHHIRRPLLIRVRGEAQPVADMQQSHSIEIASPREDEAVRSNHGTLFVQTLVLGTGEEEFAADLFLDEAWVATSSNGSFELENLDRGSHRLRAELKSADGELLATSEEVTFHLLRYAIPASE